MGGSVGVVGNGVPPALGVSSPPQEINERLIIKKLKNILQEKRIKLNLNQTSPNLKSPIFIKAKDDIDNHKL